MMPLRSKLNQCKNYYLPYTKYPNNHTYIHNQNNWKYHNSLYSVQVTMVCLNLHTTYSLTILYYGPNYLYTCVYHNAYIIVHLILYNITIINYLYISRYERIHVKKISITQCYPMDGTMVYLYHLLINHIIYGYQYITAISLQPHRDQVTHTCIYIRRSHELHGQCHSPIITIIRDSLSTHLIQYLLTSKCRFARSLTNGKFLNFQASNKWILRSITFLEVNQVWTIVPRQARNHQALLMETPVSTNKKLIGKKAQFKFIRFRISRNGLFYIHYFNTILPHGSYMVHLDHHYHFGENRYPNLIMRTTLTTVSTANYAELQHATIA